jgi:hypothetical protein
MESGKELNSNETKRRFRFKIVSPKGRIMRYNYVGESALEVEEMLWGNMPDAISITCLGEVPFQDGPNSVIEQMDSATLRQ